MEVFSPDVTPEEVREHRRGATIGHASDGRLFVVRALGETDTQTTVLEIPRAFAPERRPTQAEPGAFAGRTGRVAHYRLLERLGRGGMGVVYRAEDTKLRRTVALKFLPSGLTRDLTAKARFLQEAQAASALDHTNICTIYEVGEAGDGELYLAMACYDGETVRAKIDRGPLPLAEALDVALQTAQGLAKAHRHGIVHRDIKPANLMVTGDGAVKILDFGIAKLAADQSLGGAFAGTPAYMSPEQARGEEVDVRADVWALGVVLHEMLTGTRPSEGRLAPGLPKGLEPVLRNMLAPSLVDRYPSAVEALANLQAFQGSKSAARNTRRALLWSAAAALLAGVLVTGIWLSRREEPPVQGTFTRLTDQEGREEFPSLSPDGTSFVYVRTVDGQRDLYWQPVGSNTPTLLTPDSPLDDTQPAFSPNGRTIVFRSERDGGGIYLVEIAGGEVRRVTDFGYNPAWSPDGREIAVATDLVNDPVVRSPESQIWRVDLKSGRKRLIVRSDSVQPSWSPHGGRIAYWGLSAGNDRRILWTVAANGGEPVLALEDRHLNWNPVWSPDGSHLYFSSNRNGSFNMWRLPIDEGSGAVLGSPQLVPSNPGSGFASFSRDGRNLLYAADESKSNLERFAFDAEKSTVASAEVPLTSGTRSVRSCDVSPDGQWIAFHENVPQEDIFVVRADGTGSSRRLTNDSYKDRHPSWSPDGRWLLFYSNRHGHYGAWLIHPDGSGLAPVYESREPAIFPVWAPDGKRIACVLGKSAVVIDLEQQFERRAPESLPSRPGDIFYPTTWSADGKWLAGNLISFDSVRIGLFSFQAGSYKILDIEGSEPLWLRDNRRILYLDEGRGISVVNVSTMEKRKVLDPKPNSQFRSVCLSHGQHDLFAVQNIKEGDVWLLTFDQ